MNLVFFQKVAFTVSNSNILILGTYMMAGYKDCSTGNEFGLFSESGIGNSVAMFLEDVQNLHTYLKALCWQLCVTDLAYTVE